MKTLGDLAHGRDNNLNLIRMIAALAVLVSHAFPISLGAGTRQPFETLTGHSLGGLAVSVFFVISGYLIAESFARSKSWQDFLVARVLRLWPALVLSLLIVAFVMGPLVGRLAIGAYLSHPETWTFLLYNTALYDPQYTLPGVFKGNIYPDVEGSIWTLFYEVVCYMGIFCAGLLGLLRHKWLMSGALLGVAVFYVGSEVLDPALPRKAENMILLALPFAIGTALWVWKDRITLSLLGVSGLLVLTVALARSPAFDLSLMAFLAYTTFWLAYIPAGRIRAYNRLGDYSYGVYIYAFPMQGLAVWIVGGGTMDPYLNMVLAFPLTLVPSILSWHLVEKPALAQRKRLGAWLSQRKTAA